jgi:WD40 repeat protein
LSTDCNHKFIAAIAVNAIKIFNVKRLELLHTLNYGDSPNSFVTFAGFIPRTDKILSVIGDTQLNVLTWNLKSLKHLFLTTLFEKWRKVQKLEGPVEPLTIRSIGISSDGNLTAVSCSHGSIIILSNTTWAITKVITIPSSTSVVNVGLLTAGGREIFLCYTTTANALVISKADPGHSHPYIINQENSNGFVISHNSQMLFNIQKSGEVIVYNVRCLFGCLKPEVSASTTRSMQQRSSNRPCNSEQRLGKLFDEVSTVEGVSF